MGAWDGNLSNGNKAPLGTYIYEISYRELKDSEVSYLYGSITLVR